MKIVIPSRGRPSSVRTLECLKYDDITLVVPRDEVTAYARNIGERHPNAEIYGRDFANIMEKRQWILDKWARDHRIVMMDDDLRFRCRDNGKFRAAGTKDVTSMLLRIAAAFDHGSVHVGIADEFMCQHRPPDHEIGGRYNQVLGYDFVGWRPEAIPRYRLTINEEHDLHMQLLRAGYRPYILTDFTKGSKYNATGGCSVWRTPELEVAQFREFERLWPGIVQVVPVKNSISGVGTRVAWRKVRP